MYVTRRPRQRRPFRIVLMLPGDVSPGTDRRFYSVDPDLLHSIRDLRVQLSLSYGITENRIALYMNQIRLMPDDPISVLRDGDSVRLEVSPFPEAPDPLPSNNSTGSATNRMPVFQIPVPQTSRLVPSSSSGQRSSNPMRIWQPLVSNGMSNVMGGCSGRFPTTQDQNNGDDVVPMVANYARHLMARYRRNQRLMSQCSSSSSSGGPFTACSNRSRQGGTSNSHSALSASINYVRSLGLSSGTPARQTTAVPSSDTPARQCTSASSSSTSSGQITNAPSSGTPTRQITNAPVEYVSGFYVLKPMPPPAHHTNASVSNYCLAAQSFAQVNPLDFTQGAHSQQSELSDINASNQRSTKHEQQTEGDATQTPDSASDPPRSQSAPRALEVSERAQFDFEKQKFAPERSKTAPAEFSEWRPLTSEESEPVHEWPQAVPQEFIDSAQLVHQRPQLSESVQEEQPFNQTISGSYSQNTNANNFTPEQFTMVYDGILNILHKLKGHFINSFRENYDRPVFPLILSGNPTSNSRNSAALTDLRIIPASALHRSVLDVLETDVSRVFDGEELNNNNGTGDSEMTELQETAANVVKKRKLTSDTDEDPENFDGQTLLGNEAPSFSGSGPQRKSKRRRKRKKKSKRSTQALSTENGVGPSYSQYIPVVVPAPERIHIRFKDNYPDHDSNGSSSSSDESPEDHRQLGTSNDGKVAHNDIKSEDDDHEVMDIIKNSGAKKEVKAANGSGINELDSSEDSTDENEDQSVKNISNGQKSLKYPDRNIETFCLVDMDFNQHLDQILATMPKPSNPNMSVLKKAFEKNIQSLMTIKEFPITPDYEMKFENPIIITTASKDIDTDSQRNNIVSPHCNGIPDYLEVPLKAPSSVSENESSSRSIIIPDDTPPDSNYSPIHSTRSDSEIFDANGLITILKNAIEHYGALGFQYPRSRRDVQFKELRGRSPDKNEEFLLSSFICTCPDNVNDDDILLRRRCMRCIMIRDIIFDIFKSTVTVISLNNESHVFDFDALMDDGDSDTILIGSVIIFKMLRLDSRFCPVISAPIIGMIVNYQKDTRGVSIYILDGLAEFDVPIGPLNAVNEAEENEMRGTVYILRDDLMNVRQIALIEINDEFDKDRSLSAKNEHTADDSRISQIDENSNAP